MTTTTTTATTPDLSRIRLGTAPDSWGVWFPDHPEQTPWGRFLDEVAEAGYDWIELGPYGYLPTDPDRLADELAARGLRLSGGTVAVGLHRGPEALAEAMEASRRVARLVTALGARHLVLLPEGYRGLDGSYTGPAELTAQEWRHLTTGMDQLARMLRDELGVQLAFHPHADSHVDTQPRVERLLADTDPDAVRLCLDTGHISYCGGDNLALVRAHPGRMAYVHLKQVDPAVLERVRAEDLDFAAATRLGAMVEPPLGIPAMEPLLAELAALDVPLFAIVEQDLFPCSPETPLPIARRTRGYLAGCGLSG